MEKRVGEIDVVCHIGDITELEVDAIVNAANSDLWMGGGVAGAIKRKGGVEIESEAMSKGPIKPGEAVITNGGDLSAGYVVHCAGMPPGGRATYENVRNSVRAALMLAAENNIEQIAFPAIGAGIGGLSREQSAQGILESVVEFSHKPGSVKKVLLVSLDGTMNEVFEETVDNITREKP